MSHLICKTHKRRVVVSEGKAIHRSTAAGELSASCGTKLVISGVAVYPTSSPFFHSKTKDEFAEALLAEIFTGGEKS
jgi:hypothetical protein